MKEIKLSQGLTTKVDDEDFKYLNQFKWYVAKTNKHYYAMRKTSRNNTEGRETILMHREIMHTPFDKEVDHINNDGLNNQKFNLRNCTGEENRLNRVAGGKSKYIGVSWGTSGRYINARIGCNKKLIHLGSFKTEEEAAIAYDKKALKLFGEFAHLNFPAMRDGKIKQNGQSK